MRVPSFDCIRWASELKTPQGIPSPINESYLPNSAAEWLSTQMISAGGGLALSKDTADAAEYGQAAGAFAEILEKKRRDTLGRALFPH